MRNAHIPGVDYGLIRSGDSRDRTRFIDAFAEQFRTYGFGVVSKGPIHRSRIRQLYEAAGRVFRMRDAAKKLYEEGDRQRGYTSFGVETAQGHAFADNKEFWHIGRAPEELPDDYPEEALRVYRPNKIPTRFPQFGTLAREVFEEREAFGIFLLRCIEKAFGFPEGFLARMAKYGDSILRIIRYPSPKERWIAGAVRSGAHTDINLITGLVESVTGGLQILKRGGNRMVDADYLPIDLEEHDSVWNAGDKLAWMTDEIPSTVHRVVNPDDPSSERFSMPFFLHPRPECLLIPQAGVNRSPRITQEFLLNRLLEIKVLETMPVVNWEEWKRYSEVDYGTR